MVKRCGQKFANGVLQILSNRTSAASLALMLLLMGTCTFIAAIAGPNFSEPPTEERLAILIGAGEYPERVPRLPFVRDDVEELSATFLSAGYVVVSLLNHGSTSAREATKKAIEEELKRRLSRASENTVIVVYLSGHGVRHHDGQYYFLPVDVDPDRLAETAIPVPWLRQQLQGAKGKLKLLILDTCHAGDPGKPEDSKLRISGIQRGFIDLPGVYVLASCRSGEKSWVWREKQRSLFTYWLIRGLKGQADGDGTGGKPDAMITADELYYYTLERVRDVAQNVLRSEQNPDRLTGPGVSPDCPVVRLKPEPLDRALDEIAELVATVAQLRGLQKIAVLDFHIEEGNQNGRSFGPEARRYCAERVYTWLTTNTGGMFEVLVREFVQQHFRKLGVSSEDVLTKPQLDLPLPELSPGAVVAGTLEEWEPPNVRLRVVLRSAEAPAVRADFRVLAQVPNELRAQLEDKSVEAEPRDGWVPEAPQERPWQGKDSPFQVFVSVRGQPRPLKIVDSRVYVPLDPGDVYQIYLRIDGAKVHPLLSEHFPCFRDEDHADRPWLILARVLVDGKNTLPEKPRVRSEGLKAKAVEPEAREEPGQFVDIRAARPWFLSVSQSKVGLVFIPGFVSRLPEAASSSQTSDRSKRSSYTGELEYREFIVGEAKDPKQYSAWDYAEELGVITVAFYTSRSTEVVTRGPVLVTDPGKGGRVETKIRRGLVPDKLLATLKLHYVPTEEWNRLRGVVIQPH
ncbi:MAG: caspase family protein [Thermoguttaceae bacterium]|nr:caspase family protein [Thermoguttaceae bacterium]MDW8079808.1 caspase family protein [Thermoguttaceae bacterium]